MQKHIESAFLMSVHGSRGVAGQREEILRASRELCAQLVRNLLRAAELPAAY